MTGQPGEVFPEWRELKGKGKSDPGDNMWPCLLVPLWDWDFSYHLAQHLYLASRLQLLVAAGGDVYGTPI